LSKCIVSEKDVTTTKIINDSHYASASIRTSFSGLNLKQLGNVIPTTIKEVVVSKIKAVELKKEV